MVEKISEDLVSLCEPRMPLRLGRQVSWEDLEKNTQHFGEVITSKCFVQTKPPYYKRLSKKY